VKTIVQDIDPDAVIVVHPLADAEGGMIKKADFH
jgi:uncharacterized membrane-anchored protein YitT (DUF2179 family)